MLCLKISVKKFVGMGKQHQRSTQTFSETVSLNAKIDDYKKNWQIVFHSWGKIIMKGIRPTFRRNIRAFLNGLPC